VGPAVFSFKTNTANEIIRKNPGIVGQTKQALKKKFPWDFLLRANCLSFLLSHYVGNCEVSFSFSKKNFFFLLFLFFFFFQGVDLVVEKK